MVAAEDVCNLAHVCFSMHGGQGGTIWIQLLLA